SSATQNSSTLRLQCSAPAFSCNRRTSSQHPSSGWASFTCSFSPCFAFSSILVPVYAYLRARILSVSLRMSFGGDNSWCWLRVRLRFLVNACVLGVKIIGPSHNSAQVCGFTERGIPRCLQVRWQFRDVSTKVLFGRPQPRRYARTANVRPF